MLDVQNLTLAFASSAENPTVSGVSFCLEQGKVLALVGESGSGKTLVAKRLMQLQPKDCCTLSGEIVFNGVRIDQFDAVQMRAVRGKDIGFILQEPMVSLNPSLKIGEQMVEGLILHRGVSQVEAKRQAIALLEKVGVNEPEKRFYQYPHEFSGGMRQRIVIASVMLLKPKLVIADEPTTALDATIQAEVMQLMLDLTEEINAAVLLITHDLSVVADYANDVLVMQKGHIVENKSTAELFARPAHNYTRKLLDALPRIAKTERNVTDTDVVADIANVSIDFVESGFFPWQKDNVFSAVTDASIRIYKGEVVALVGESGSGKTTLGRTLVGMKKPALGTVSLMGQELYESSPEGRNPYPEKAQLIFQDPYSSLNPRLTIEQIVAEGILDKENKKHAAQAILDALIEVGLDANFLNRYPHQLSGGQRQRVCIARAMISNPSLIVADEPVAALDLTVQAKVLSLIKRLQRDRHFSLLFISHDLAVVQALADKVFVMEKGRIVESGPTDAIFTRPHHPYTQALLRASPFLTKSANDSGYALVKRNPRAPQTADNVVFYLNKEELGQASHKYLSVGEKHKILVLE